MRSAGGACSSATPARLGQLVQVNHALLVGRVFQSGAQTAPQQAHHLMSESFALIQPKLARELGTRAQLEQPPAETPAEAPVQHVVGDRDEEVRGGVT